MSHRSCIEIEWREPVKTSGGLLTCMVKSCMVGWGDAETSWPAWSSRVWGVGWGDADLHGQVVYEGLDGEMLTCMVKSCMRGWMGRCLLTCMVKSCMRGWMGRCWPAWSSRVWGVGWGDPDLHGQVVYEGLDGEMLIFSLKFNLKISVICDSVNTIIAPIK